MFVLYSEVVYGMRMSWEKIEKTFFMWSPQANLNAIFDRPRHCIMDQKYHPLIENVRRVKRIKEFLNDMGLLGKKYPTSCCALAERDNVLSVSFIIDMTTRYATRRRRQR